MLSLVWLPAKGRRLGHQWLNNTLVNVLALCATNLAAAAAIRNVGTQALLNLPMRLNVNGPAEKKSCLHTLLRSRDAHLRVVFRSFGNTYTQLRKANVSVARVVPTFPLTGRKYASRRQSPKQLLQAKSPNQIPWQYRESGLGFLFGADYWTRTNDLLITNELLYQLS